MAVWGIAGTPLKKLGTGKTLSAIYLALLFHKKAGLHIVSNIHIYGVPYTLMTHPRQLIGLKNSVVIIDDIYRFMGGRDSSVRKLCNIIAGESRKSRLEVIYISSVLTDMVKRTLRRHTDYYIIPEFNKKTRVLKLNVVNQLGGPERILPSHLPGQITTQLFKYYNTREPVPIITDF